MKRLIVPPLPAASRPSNSSTCWPSVSAAQRWNFSSSTCRRYLVSSYSSRGMPLVVGVVLAPGVDGPAGRVDEDRVVVVVLADGVAVDLERVDVLANVHEHERNLGPAGEQKVSRHSRRPVTTGVVFRPQCPPEQLAGRRRGRRGGRHRRAVAVGGLLPRGRADHRRRRARLVGADHGRDRAAAGAVPQPGAGRDGARHPGPAVPRPAHRRPGPRRPGLDAPGRRRGGRRP